MESNGGISTPAGNEAEEKIPGRTTVGGGNLEKLTHQELVNKCRNLLTLAHRAKVAKDEIAAELKQTKLALKNAEPKDIPQMGEAEANALQEMVANLTEGKVALTTKIESLQRQLKVSSSEVDFLQSTEKELMQQRNSLEAQNHQLLKENEATLQKLQELQVSSAEKSELLAKAWETEKIAYQEKLENLQVQIGQVDILKTKCKKFLEEKSELENELKNQQKLVAKSIRLQGELKCLKEEKKALDIIVESSKKEKKTLEGKIKDLENQDLKLKKEKEDVHKSLNLSQDRIQELENMVKEKDTSIFDLKNHFKEMQENCLKIEEEKEFLESTKTELETEHQALATKVNTLQEELKIELDKNSHLEQILTELQTQKTDQIAMSPTEVECFKEKIVEIEKNNQQKDLELQKLLEERSIAERSMQEEIEHLKSREELLMQEKRQNEDKLKMMWVDLVDLKNKHTVMEEESCNNEREKNDLTAKLKETEEENRKLIEHSKQRDLEHIVFIENQKESDELIAQVNKLSLEVQQLTEENKKLLKSSEDLENEVSLMRENVEVVQREKTSMEIKISKFVEEVEQSSESAAVEKDRADHLSKHIKELKSENAELNSQVELIQKEAESTKILLGKLQNSGISIISMCKRMYPTISKTMFIDDHEDVLTMMQIVEEILSAALAKRDNFSLEKNMQCIVHALGHVQEQSKNLIESRDFSAWESLSSGFNNINKSLVTFYMHAAGILEVEKDLPVEEIFKDISSLFAKLCTVLKEGRITLNNVTSTVDELRKEKTHLENIAVETEKEKEIISQKLNDSLNHIESIVKEKNEQLENHNNIIADYEKSHKLFNQSIEEEKLLLKERISELEVKLLSSENKRIELETKLLSGDSQNKEKVDESREQFTIVKAECEALARKYKEAVTETEKFEQIIEKQVKDLQSLSIEKDVLVSEKNAVKQENESLKNAVDNITKQDAAKEKIWSDEKQDLENKLAIAFNEIIIHEQDYTSLNESKKLVQESLTEEKRKLEEKLEAIIMEQEIQIQEAAAMKGENNVLQTKIQTLQTKIEQLIEDANKFQSNMKVAKDEIQALKHEKEHIEKELKDADNQKLQLRSSIEASTGRCEDLLTELNGMNKILRERGERISRLEDSNKEKSEELEKTTIQLKELKVKYEAELASKQEQLQTITERLHSFNSDSTVTSPAQNDHHNSDSEVKTLEQEKTNLKKTALPLDSDPGSVHDCQSEVMSTSTISRAEDTQRMKELEDTFEERYMKLKSVAIKLKKRVAELTAQLNSSEEMCSKLATERDDNKNKASKNVQALQGEIDRLQDEVDSKAKELKDQGKQLVLAAEQLAAVKSELAAAQDENGLLHRTVKNLEETISSQETAAGSLRGQITSLEKRLSTELTKQQLLEDRKKKAEERLEEERQRAAHAVKELEEAKQDVKTRSLLDLEMRDYELTVEELNGQLAEKDYCITELQETIEREKGRSNSLQDQLAHLTTQEATERERAEKMKKLLLDHKTQLAELRLAQEAQSAATEKAQITIEQLTQEIEKQKLLTAEVSNEKIKLEELAKRSKLSSERQIEILEEQLLKHKVEVQQLMAERDTIRNEFEGYRVRAASVLRQKSRPPDVNINELQSEKEELQADCEVAQLKVQQLQSELSTLQAEYTFMQSEKDGIAKKLLSLSEELNRRESSHHEKITSLESKMEAKMAEYQRIITSMANQNEAMSNNFKKQLDTLKQTHSREVEQLTAKLEECEDKLWQLKNTISTSVTATPASANTTMSTIPTAPHPLRSENDHTVPGVNHTNTQQHRRQLSLGYDEPRIDVTNMVREEGEGSEWVEPVHRSPGKQRGYSPPPLEQLINSPLTSQDDNVSIASINTDATGKEMARLEAKLSAGEMRIQQLTTLLHESEAENAKLTQLSDALKEEIRRSVRNEVREKHMENTEYMKNVILKFLLLKNGEERKHLVPVLKTVLQLSPSETSQLELLAFGDEGEGGSQAGWGSYLHLWSSR
ncbi:GRIP and coiled-coil domain-containing protein 2-like isoform X1 [Cherax quadricarinatus]